MSKLPFIIIGLLSLVACKTDKTSVPQGFECFNQPHIYIKYKQFINGYTVKVMWLQNGEIGNALFCLEKQGVQYYYFAEKWTDKILYDKGNTYPNNTVIELDYTAKLKSEEYLSDDSTLYRKQKHHLQSWKTDNVSLIQKTRPLLFTVLMVGAILSIRPIN